MSTFPATQIFPFCQALDYAPNTPLSFKGQGFHYVTNLSASGKRQSRRLATLPRQFGPWVWTSQTNDFTVLEELENFFEFHAGGGRMFVLFDFYPRTWGQKDPTGVMSGVVPIGTGDGRARLFHAPFRGSPDWWPLYRASASDPWTEFDDSAPEWPALNAGLGSFGRDQVAFPEGYGPADGLELATRFTGQRFFPARLLEEACDLKLLDTTWQAQLTAMEAIGEAPTLAYQLWAAGSWALTSVGAGDTAKVNDGDETAIAFDLTPAAESHARLDCGAAKKMGKLRIRTTGGFDPTWKVERSANNSTWNEVPLYYPNVPIGRASAPTGVEIEWQDTPFRYWRFNKGSSASQAYQVTELQFYEAP